MKKEEGTERRGIEFYMKNGKFILSQPVNLILFADKDIAVECQMLRNKHMLDHKTLIIPMEIKDLPYYSHLEKFKEAREKNPMVNGSASKDTPLFTMLTWCKFYFISKAIQLNPFLSTHFAWVDFGITYVANTSYVEMDKIFTDFPDKIKLLTLRNLAPKDLSPNNTSFNGKVEFIKKYYYSAERGLVAAGYMTGGFKEWKLFITLFEKEAMKLLNEEIAASEQQIIPILMLNNPKLFTSYRGDYDAVLSNYKNFRMSLFNVKEYTMKSLRLRYNNNNYSCYTGKQIFNSIVIGEYDPLNQEEPSVLLEFLHELFYALVKINDFYGANKIKEFYHDLLKLDKYKNIDQNEKFIP